MMCAGIPRNIDTIAAAGPMNKIDTIKTMKIFIGFSLSNSSHTGVKTAIVPQKVATRALATAVAISFSASNHKFISLPGGLSTRSGEALAVPRHCLPIVCRFPIRNSNQFVLTDDTPWFYRGIHYYFFVTNAAQGHGGKPPGFAAARLARPPAGCPAGSRRCRPVPFGICLAKTQAVYCENRNSLLRVGWRSGCAMGRWRAAIRSVGPAGGGIY